MPLVQRTVVKADLIKQAQRLFSASGWRVEETKNPEVDFVVSYDDFRLFVQCVDKAMLLQSVVTKMVEQYEACSRSMLFYRKETLIYLTNFDLSTTPYLLEKCILLINIRDLKPVLELPRRVHDLPELDDPRLLAILSSRNKILLKISDHYLSQQKMEKALEWAAHSVKCYPTDIQSYNKITNILLLMRDFAAAETFIRQGLQYHPKNTVLLKRFVTVLRQLGKSEEQTMIEQKIATITSDKEVRYTTAADFVRYHENPPPTESGADTAAEGFSFSKLMQRLGLGTRGRSSS
jgi:tetratricopeptide (TPR) repeat protein